MNRGVKWGLSNLSAFLLAIALAGSVFAQKITGSWQGTITTPEGTPRRIILRVIDGDGGAYKAKIYSIDQNFTGDWVDSMTVHNSTVRFAVGMLQLSYDGKLSADGKTITGTWTQGGSTPFTFQKTTPATAWPLPRDPSPHTVKLVTVEPGVQLEVLDWGGTGRPSSSSALWATPRTNSTSSRPNLLADIMRTASPAAALASPAILRPTTTIIRPTVWATMFLPSSLPFIWISQACLSQSWSATQSPAKS